MLTDRQRVELALPARLMFNAFESAWSALDNAEARALSNDLVTASCEPLKGLAPNEAHKIIRRIERAATDLSKPFSGKVSAGKMALITFYFTEELIERGILELYEGSPMARGVERFMGAMPAKFDEPDVVKSAKKQGRKLVEVCQAMGFYQ